LSLNPPFSRAFTLRCPVLLGLSAARPVRLESFAGPDAPPFCVYTG